MMKIRSIKGISLAVIVLISFCFLIAPAYAQTYERETSGKHTYQGGDVTLTKAASWTDAAKEHAEVTLTFDGLRQVIIEEETADVLFVVDTSASMTYQGGCINPEHHTVRTYSISNSNAMATLGLDWNTKLKPLITAAAGDGTIVYSSDKLNENLLIKVPDGLMSVVGADLYLYPAKTDFSNYSDKSFNNVVYDVQTWAVVDFNNLNLANTQAVHYWYHFKYDEGNNMIRLGYPQNPNNGDFNPIWINGTNNQGQPRWWDVSDHDCIVRVHGLYDALEAFSADLLANKPHSRIAFAAFNNSALQNASQAALGFTGSKGDIDTYLYNTLVSSTGNTNYEAGLISAKTLLDADTDQDNGHKKILIFVTDGMPNRVCVGGDLTSYATQNDMALAFGNANAVMDTIKAAYPELTVCCATFSLDRPEYLTNYVEPLLTADGSIFVVDTYTSSSNPFIGAFNDLYSTYVKTTKVVNLTDIIDNRYFTVDETVLAAAGYVPDKCTVDVQEDVIDGKTVQVVTFTYKADATQNELESVKIPLIFVDGAVAPNDENYYPTNYDPAGSSGGACAEYTDLEKQDKTIEVPKVWLQKSEDDVFDFVLHDMFNGIDQASQKGVPLTEWDTGVSTPKRIWLENKDTSTGNIHVRVKLTETLFIDGENKMNKDIYIGCAPFPAGGAWNETAYKASFIEDKSISHQITGWTLGAPVYNMGTWDGVTTGDFWLMDKHTGYAYWMQELVPGEKTGDFLNALILKTEQDKVMDYTIDVSADAISTDEDFELWMSR